MRRTKSRRAYQAIVNYTEGIKRSTKPETKAQLQRSIDAAYDADPLWFAQEQAECSEHTDLKEIIRDCVGQYERDVQPYYRSRFFRWSFKLFSLLRR